MNVLFLTMTNFGDGSEFGIYTDLMCKFRDEGHNVYVIYPLERRFHIATNLKATNGMIILGVHTLNVQKSNLLEKSFGQVSLEYLYKKAAKRKFGNIKFDLITYSTPPITLTKVIKWAKNNNPKAITYLQLKDIFPQNAVDLGMITKFGAKGILYRYFRKKEKMLYELSNYIGCMSPANVKYVLDNYRWLDADKVEICPNSYAIHSPECIVQRESVRMKYGLPVDKPIFIYGGNLGKPQGISFLLECLKANKDRTDSYFVVVGNGTECSKIETWVKNENPTSVTLFHYLPKAEYDKLIRACDVGLIFLDYRFTIPNYPSRLLSYIMCGKPIIACTDSNSDVGKIAQENGYGLWTPSNSVKAFSKAVDKMLQSDTGAMGKLGYEFFLKNYTVEKTYEAIMKHFL